MKKYKISIKGVSPLLMNRFIESGQLETTKKKVISTQKTAVEDKLYTLDGKVYLPARYFEASMIEAGKNFKGKGRGNLSKIMGSMVSVSPEGYAL